MIGTTSEHPVVLEPACEASICYQHSTYMYLPKGTDQNKFLTKTAPFYTLHIFLIKADKSTLLHKCV